MKAAKTLPQSTMIVATDKGIFFKMQQMVPEKQLIEAPTAGAGPPAAAVLIAQTDGIEWIENRRTSTTRDALVKRHEVFVDEATRVKSQCL
ncbi:hypothetical protein ACT691_09255 [Vibrio metschnikovii]